MWSCAGLRGWGGLGWVSSVATPIQADIAGKRIWSIRSERAPPQPKNVFLHVKHGCRGTQVKRETGRECDKLISLGENSMRFPILFRWSGCEVLGVLIVVRNGLTLRQLGKAPYFVVAYPGVPWDSRGDFIYCR